MINSSAKRTLWTIATVVATALSSGCATTVTLIGQRDDPVLLAERGTDGMTRVELTVGNSHFLAAWGIQYGWLADWLVAGARPLSLVARQAALLNKEQTPTWRGEPAVLQRGLLP